jgi:hypothetical protein
VLEALANNDDENVRIEVANNPSTPARVLEALAKDKERSVREFVATNPRTPLRALEVLAKDKDEWVRDCVAENPSTPESLSASVPEALAKDASSEIHRWAIARNSSTPLSALETLAKDESFKVSFRALGEGIISESKAVMVTAARPSILPEEGRRRDRARRIGSVEGPWAYLARLAPRVWLTALN